MATNIEIKAVARAFDDQLAIAAKLATAGPTVQVQRDTFFVVPTGRLKLREIEGREAELIQYVRPDRVEPEASEYTIVKVPDPCALLTALSRSLGIRGVVEKHRTVFLQSETRIHFDQVRGLGEFIELEVVCDSSDTHDQGYRVATDLMQALMIDDSDLIACAYIDLLEQRSPRV